MTKYKLRQAQYCALSGESKFHTWLHKSYPDLHVLLMKHLEITNSCKSNRDKMIEIQNKIETSGGINGLISFLLKEYPSVIEQILEKGELQSKYSKTKQVTSNYNTKVFSYYNPILLTFPQKMILYSDDHESLRRDTLNFCKDKINYDYIIVGNEAYIEYFKTQYWVEAKNVPIQSREIYQYRQKMGIDSNIKVFYV